MIKAKPKQCSRCDKMSILWQSQPPLCKSCASQVKPNKPLYRTKEIKKVKTPTVEEIQRNNARNVFFADQVIQAPLYCEDCNKPLKAISFFQYRSITAHILPKSKFPSVELHPLNRMFLGASFFSDCGCHGNWDHSDADTRKTMKCYSLAIERLQAFKHLLTPKEQVMAEKYLATSLDN